MNRLEYIIVGLVIVLGCVSVGGWKYVKYQDYLKQQAVDNTQASSDSSTQSIPVESQPPQVAQDTNKQELQTCISNANQQEISALQDEKNTIAEDNVSGTYYDTDSVNSYIQQIQQDTQTQITECEAEYPQ